MGTKWSNNEHSKYEITGVNVKVEIPTSTFYTVEVTHTSRYYVSKQYYAKDLGVVKGTSKVYDDSLLIKVEY